MMHSQTNVRIDWLSREITISERQPPLGGLRLSIEVGLNRVSGAFPMAFTLTVTQQVSCSVHAVDARGNAARLDGVPVWAVEPPGVVSVTPAEDGLSAVVAAIGPIGTAQLRLTADADLGDGVRELVGLLDLEVVAGEAVALGLLPGVPEEQPVA